MIELDKFYVTREDEREAKVIEREVVSFKHDVVEDYEKVELILRHNNISAHAEALRRLNKQRILIDPDQTGLIQNLERDIRNQKFILETIVLVHDVDEFRYKKGEIRKMSLISPVGGDYYKNRCRELQNEMSQFSADVRDCALKVLIERKKREQEIIKHTEDSILILTSLGNSVQAATS